MFFAPTKDKTTLFTMFFFSRNPKIEPKSGIYDVFATVKKVFLENGGKHKLT